MILRILYFAVCLMSAMSVSAEQVVIQTKSNTMVINAEQGRQPRYVYYGQQLSAQELQHLQQPAVSGRTEVYPVYGLNTPAEAALAMRHADGNLSTALVVTGVERRAEADGTVTVIAMKDPVYPTTVNLCYMA